MGIDVGFVIDNICFFFIFLVSGSFILFRVGLFKRFLWRLCESGGREDKDI